MAVFEDVTLEWGGRKYTIVSDRVMGAIGRIERHLTLKEIHEAVARRGTVPQATVSEAYAAVLQYAGATVTADEIYQSFFLKDSTATMPAALNGLLVLMIPPAHLVPKSGGDTLAGKAGPTVAKSSRKRSRPRSATGG